MHLAVVLFEAVGVLVLVLGSTRCVRYRGRRCSAWNACLQDPPPQPGAGDPARPGDPHRRRHHHDHHDRPNADERYHARDRRPRSYVPQLLAGDRARWRSPVAAGRSHRQGRPGRGLMANRSSARSSVRASSRSRSRRSLAGSRNGSRDVPSRSRPSGAGAPPADSGGSSSARRDESRPSGLAAGIVRLAGRCCMTCPGERPRGFEGTQQACATSSGWPGV